MTIEQITAINNAMSLLSDIAQYAGSTNSVEEFREYTSRHIKALKDAGVNEYIVEHFEYLINSWTPIAQESESQCRRWEGPCGDFNEASNEYYPSLDLAALQELKAKLNS